MYGVYVEISYSNELFTALYAVLLLNARLVSVESLSELVDGIWRVEWRVVEPTMEAATARIGATWRGKEGRRRPVEGGAQGCQRGH